MRKTEFDVRPLTDASWLVAERGSRRDAIDVERRAQAQVLLDGKQVSRGPLTSDDRHIGINHPRRGPFSPVEKKSWAEKSFRPGVHVEGQQTSFAVRAPNATTVVLEIYDGPTGKDAVFDYLMRKTPDGKWQAKLEGVPSGTHYGFRVFGPNWEYTRSFQRGGSDAGFRADVLEGHRFNPNKITTGSHAIEISHEHQPEHFQAYLSGPDLYEGRPQREFDTGRIAPKGIVVNDRTETGARPHVPWKDTVVYETSVRGFTGHPSASRLEAILADREGFADVVNVPAELRGTFAGAAYMAPYLKALGITSLELMPIHQFDSSENAWGYMSQGYFAANRAYAHDKSPGGPTREFKEMLRAFHDAGIEVILDVVYNHGGWSGPKDPERPEVLTLAGLRALDNVAYHALSKDDSRFDHDSTGCGAPIDASKPDARALIRESLEYWVSLGVDGFRFDLAAALGRVKDAGYAFDSGSAMLSDMAEIAKKHDVKLLAEPWDLSGYHVGDFPAPFSEWNGQFRDTARDFIRGKGGADGIARILKGTLDLFRDGKPPINFITVHDGFTLADVVSYNGKINEQEPPFGPSDGGSDNNKSWDNWHGSAAETKAQRRQQMRNLHAILMFARGVPMILGGDELGRTQRGNNNTYKLHEVQGVNYEMLATNAPHRVNTEIGGEYHDNLGEAHGEANPIFDFTQDLLALRRSSPGLKQLGPEAPEIETWGPVEGDAHHALAALFPAGSKGDSRFLLHANSHWHDSTFEVPAAAPGKKWVRVVDTHSDEEAHGNVWKPEAAHSVAGRLAVRPRSTVVLQEVDA